MIFDLSGLEIHIAFRLSFFTYLSRKDDGDDEAIDGDGLAEDDRDQVLRLDPGALKQSN